MKISYKLLKLNKGAVGLTVIELLVVIAIIGLLASIILISVKNTRERARIAKGLEFSASIFHGLGLEAVGIWNFDEGVENTCSGGEDTCDSSGYKNHGTIYGGASYTNETPHRIIGLGSGKYALNFFGVGGNYVEVPNSQSLNVKAITIEMWVRPDSGPSSNKLVAKGGRYYAEFDSFNLVEWQI